MKKTTGEILDVNEIREKVGLCGCWFVLCVEGGWMLGDGGVVLCQE